MEYESIEEELCDICKVKKDKYPNRQDLLAAILKAIDKLPEVDYDRMTEDAYQWQKQATRHFNHRISLPDFPDVSTEEVNGEPLQATLEDIKEAGQDVTDSGTAPKSTPSKRQLPTRRVPDYENLTGEKDKFGITIGTNTHEAVKMYERGCTARDVEQALGGRYRNVLRKLADEGHLVEKLGSGVYRVTHKDNKS